MAALPLAPSIAPPAPDPVAQFARTHPMPWGVQRDTAREVVRAAHEHGVPVDVALRRTWAESRMRPWVVGAAGELGALQVMPRWFPEVERQSAAERIDTGMRILADAYRACGDWRRAERKYQTGRCE